MELSNCYFHVNFENSSLASIENKNIILAQIKFGKIWYSRLASLTKFGICAWQVWQNFVFALGKSGKIWYSRKFDGSFANVESVATLATVASLVSLGREG